MAEKVTYRYEDIGKDFVIEEKLVVDIDGDSDLAHLSIFRPTDYYQLSRSLVSALGGFSHNDTMIFIRALENLKAKLPKKDGDNLTTLVNLAFHIGWNDCYRMNEDYLEECR